MDEESMSFGNDRRLPIRDSNKHCSPYSKRRLALFVGILSVGIVATGSSALAAPLVSGNYLVMDGFSLFQVDSITGDRSILSSGFVSAHGVAVNRNGNIYVTESSTGRIYQVDAASGQTTIISGVADDGRSIGIGPALAYPIGLIFGESGELIVADRDVQAVFSVDPQTGDRRILSGGPAPVGQGDDVFFPHDVFRLSSGQILVGGAGMNALVEVDPPNWRPTRCKPLVAKRSDWYRI